VIVFAVFLALYLLANQDNLNPKWVTSFKIAYHFEKVQPLMFKVYDIDDKNASLDKQDFIGHAVRLGHALLVLLTWRSAAVMLTTLDRFQECRLSELMTSSGQTLVLTLVYARLLPFTHVRSSSVPGSS
jgi:hypothetical protein